MSKSNLIYTPTLSPAVIAKSYADWFEKRIDAFLDRHRLPFQPYDGYVEANTRFVTFTFDRRKIARRQSRLSASEGSTFPNRTSCRRELSAEFDNVDRLYKDVCEAILGRNFHRPSKRQRQPLMIAAADVNGTRYWKSSGPIENVHIHSIWVFANGQRGRFREVLDAVKNDCTDRYDFDAIDVRKVNGDLPSKQKDVKRLASYTSKFLGFNTLDMKIGEDVAIYERGNE
ncbi:hypothetical protein AB9F36_11635 [Rhizobium leguminosarum]|uniref:hypothetical protein n=1 Tax=Rhizobium leguminosarum TaxID=384 RepID=UPI003F988FCC